MSTIFSRIWKFPGYGRHGKKYVEIHVEIQDKEIILHVEIILNMEAKHHTLYHKIVGRRKQIYCQEYNLYVYSINK